MEFLAIVGLGLLILLVWGVSTHNKAVRLRQTLRESWANIDVQLRRRHDLIPNLVEVARGYAKHESELFERIAQARETAITAIDQVRELARAEGELVGAVNTLLGRVEDYPDLKANRQFLVLQEELVETEDRVAAARRFYNANVRDLNTLIESFPASLLVGSQDRADFFEVEEIAIREPVRVSLSNG